MIRISRPEAKREFQKTPAEIIAGVEEEPGGMKLHEVVRLINDIAATIAEPMPRLTIKIRNMLSQLPLLKPDAPPAQPGRKRQN